MADDKTQNPNLDDGVAADDKTVADAKEKVAESKAAEQADAAKTAPKAEKADAKSEDKPEKTSSSKAADAKKEGAQKEGAKKEGAKKPAAKKTAKKDDEKDDAKPASKAKASAKSEGKSTAKSQSKAKAEGKGKDDAKAEKDDADATKGEKKTSTKSGGRKAKEAPKRKVVPDEPVLVRATAKYVRSSPRKSRLVIDHIRGKSVEDARVTLQFMQRHVARDVLKVLNSAVANAEHNHELDAEDLNVALAWADDGPVFKRWRPRARGRATQILKRTSHITVVVSNKTAKEIGKVVA